MSYTPRKIAGIDTSKLGIVDKQYQDTEGYWYRGLENGRLFKYTKALETSYGTTNVDAELNRLNTVVSSIVEDYVLRNELAVAIDDSKSFALAMSMIL